MESLAGRLLVASPLLLDPNFHRSVVLMCAHDARGAFGVVLNRPLGFALPRELAAWAPRLSEPPTVFHGGPVAPEQVLALARLVEGAPPLEGWSRVAGRVGLLDLEREDLAEHPSIEAVRLFAGHAGWGGGQLEGEIGGEAWFVLDARESDAFAASTERLWNEVLGRQPSRLGLLKHYPPDVSLN